MDKTTPDDYLTAVLKPDQKAREELYRKRLAEEKRLAKLRKVAWLTLAGTLVGAGVAMMTGHRPATGVLWGGFPAAILGWLLILLGSRRAAS